MMSNFKLAKIKAEGTRVSYDIGQHDDLKDDPTRRYSTYETLIPDPDGFKATPTTKYICQCGSDEFRAYDNPGGYETSIRCTDCDEIYIVHEG